MIGILRQLKCTSTGTEKSDRLTERYACLMDENKYTVTLSV